VDDASAVDEGSFEQPWIAQLLIANEVAHTCAWKEHTPVFRHQASNEDRIFSHETTFRAQSHREAPIV
jgi:hypothetical protein